jgi:hypothetical protein
MSKINILHDSLHSDSREADRNHRPPLVCAWAKNPETGRLVCSWTRPPEEDQSVSSHADDGAFLLRAAA